MNSGSDAGLDFPLWYSRKKTDATAKPKGKILIERVVLFILAAFMTYWLIADREINISPPYVYFLLEWSVFSLARSRLNFFVHLIHSYSASGFMENTDETSEDRNHVMGMKKHSLRAVCFGIVLYLGAVALFIKYPLTDLLSALSRLPR